MRNALSCDEVGVSLPRLESRSICRPDILAHETTHTRTNNPYIGENTRAEQPKPTKSLHLD